MRVIRNTYSSWASAVYTNYLLLPNCTRCAVGKTTAHLTLTIDLLIRCVILRKPGISNRFMWKKPEYGLACSTLAACGGDEWGAGVWGYYQHEPFFVKRYPAA
jgi:hypothetical protein